MLTESCTPPNDLLTITAVTQSDCLQIMEYRTSPTDKRFDATDTETTHATMAALQRAYRRIRVDHGDRRRGRIFESRRDRTGGGGVPPFEL